MKINKHWTASKLQIKWKNKEGSARIVAALWRVSALPKRQRERDRESERERERGRQLKCKMN